MILTLIAFIFLIVNSIFEFSKSKEKNNKRSVIILISKIVFFAVGGIFTLFEAYNEKMFAIIFIAAFVQLIVTYIICYSKSKK